MGVAVALYLVGWTVLMGFAAFVSWKRFSKRPGADSVRSLRLEAIGNCLFFGAIAVAPSALLLGRAMPQHRVLLSQIVVCGLLAGGLAWFASRLALAAERSHTERARRGRGSTPRKRLVSPGVIAVFWLLPTFAGMLAVGVIVVMTTPAGTVRDRADPPPGMTALVAVVSVGLLGALVTGVWQHRRRALEDARILRSDMAEAVETSSFPEPPEEPA